MNNVQLIGRLTKDVEVKYTSNSKAVANITIAIDKNLNSDKKKEYKEKGISTANFIRVVIWGKQAENAQKYLSKGSCVGIIGSIQSNTYEKEGEKKYSVNVLASRLEFLNSDRFENPSKREYDTKDEADYEDEIENYDEYNSL